LGNEIGSMKIAFVGVFFSRSCCFRKPVFPGKPNFGTAPPDPLGGGLLFTGPSHEPENPGGQRGIRKTKGPRPADFFFFGEISA